MAVSMEMQKIHYRPAVHTLWILQISVCLWSCVEEGPESTMQILKGIISIFVKQSSN